MPIYDLCLAWDWQYDQDFAAHLDRACSRTGISLLQATPQNLDALLRSLELNEISIRALFDRASDTNPSFLPLLDWVCFHPVYRINPSGHARRAWDKAASHTTFSESGLPTPYTIVIPSFNEEPDLLPLDLSLLEPFFSIKPAHGGGGRGVFNGATCWDQVLAARREFPNDQYLLQAHVQPTLLNLKPAWFRIISCAGEIYPCWWDTCTHIYTPIQQEEEDTFSLEPLREITQSIGRLTRLDLFSTEIALTDQGDFVIVDYVNDPIDLRLQSKTGEGVPDWIVESIACEIAHLVMETVSV